MPEIYSSEEEKTAPEKSKESKTGQKKSTAKYACPPTLEKKPITSNPFAAFMVRPPKVSFAVQDAHEEILLLLRRHFITNLGWLLTALIMILAPLSLSIIPLIDPLPVRFQLMTLILWYLITTGYIIEKFLSWYFNVFIITDERIIDIDFLNLLYRNIATAKIENIEDVTSEVTGAIRSLFNYGNVYIQTAAERARLEFEAVPNPQEVSKILNELVIQEEQEKIDGRVR